MFLKKFQRQHAGCAGANEGPVITDLHLAAISEKKIWTLFNANLGE